MSCVFSRIDGHDARQVEFICGISVMLVGEAYSIRHKIPPANLPELHR